MSRLTWMQQSFEHSNYSKDPHQAAVLLDSITHRNISDFRYALEVMKCDPNLLDASSGLSVFQTVLQTPKSSEFIKLCINSGANFYKVKKDMFINKQLNKRFFSFSCFLETEKLQQPISNTLRHQIVLPRESRHLSEKLRSIESESKVRRPKLLTFTYRHDDQRKL